MWPPGAGPRRKGRPLNNTGRRDEPDLVSVKGAGARPAQESLAHDQVAGRLGRLAVLALCARACSRRTSPARPGSRVGGVAADRVARGRSRADQILALDAASRYLLPPAGRLAKLRWRIERDYQELKQEVGLGHYRGARMARLPSSRHAVHRGLRIPDLRDGRRFPPQDLVPPRCSDACSYPTVIDPEDPPLRPERHIPNSIATMRIRIIDALIRTLPRCPCCGASAATYGRQKL